MIRILTAIVLLILNCAIASAQIWNCRNEAAEISCNGDKCEISKSHTPMDVSIDRSGDMEICAYSGCWQGKSSATLYSGAYITVISDSLKWSTSPTDKSTSAAVTIDTANLTAIIMIENFAHPMTCKISL